MVLYFTYYLKAVGLTILDISRRSNSTSNLITHLLCLWTKVLSLLHHAPRSFHCHAIQPFLYWVLARLCWLPKGSYPENHRGQGCCPFASLVHRVLFLYSTVLLSRVQWNSSIGYLAFSRQYFHQSEGGVDTCSLGLSNLAPKHQYHLRSSCHLTRKNDCPSILKERRIVLSSHMGQKI